MSEDRINGLARRVVDCTYEKLSENDIRLAKLCVIDCLGSILGGTTLAVKGQDLRAMAQEYGGKPESTILGFGDKVPAFLAAFANGASAHCLDNDDYFSETGVHPTAATLPGGLALAEAIGNVSGKEFIAALVGANDLLYHLSLACVPKAQKEYGLFTAHGFGFFGAAAMCGKILSLDFDDMVSCLGLMLAQQNGTAQMLNETSSNLREIYPAFSNKAGVLCAVMAKRGVKGVREVLNGKAGFLTVAMRNDFKEGPLDVKPDDPYAMEKIAFKLSPACAFALNFTDVGAIVAKENNIQIDEIDKIVLEVGKFAETLCIPREARIRPTLPMDAKFSIPFCAAAAIAEHKVPGVSAFLPDAIHDEKILGIAEKMEYVRNEKYDVDRQIEPGGLTVYMKDGRKFFAESEYQSGTPQNPVKDEDIVGKFKESASYCVKELKNVDAIVNTLLHLEDVKDMREVVALL